MGACIRGLARHSVSRAWCARLSRRELRACLQLPRRRAAGPSAVVQTCLSAWDKAWRARGPARAWTASRESAAPITDEAGAEALDPLPAHTLRGRHERRAACARALRPVHDARAQVCARALGAARVGLGAQPARGGAQSIRSAWSRAIDSQRVAARAGSAGALVRRRRSPFSPQGLRRAARTAARQRTSARLCRARPRPARRCSRRGEGAGAAA